MRHFTRFTLVFSVAAMSFAPAAWADAAAPSPSVLDGVIEAILDVLLPVIEAGPEGSLEESNASPQIIYVG